MQTVALHPGIHVEGDEHVATSIIPVPKHQSSTAVPSHDNFAYLEAKIVAMQLQINDLYLRKFDADNVDQIFIKI